MNTEVIEHNCIVPPEVGCILTQYAYSGFSKGPDKRSNVLWPKGYQKEDVTILNSPSLVAVFHITKMNPHARSN